MPRAKLDKLMSELADAIQEQRWYAARVLYAKLARLIY